jgi:4-amino-4-deoxy-L-arabinose transferase-like glycosyltransferase
MKPEHRELGWSKPEQVRGMSSTWACVLSRVYPRTRAVSGLPVLLGILASITVVRLIGLKTSTVDLFSDEAQYWDWSRQPAWGYFSKPPLLAWIIAAARQVCGDGEECIRAPAPILYLGTSLLVYALGRQLYDARVAFFAGLAVALSAGVAFSARIISTDVPLLFCWALALLAFCKLLTGNRAWAIVLGVSLGLGLLAKYAMIYFLLGVAHAAWLDAEARRLARTPAFWFALGIAALMITPNVGWNFGHGFPSITHIEETIQERGIELNPLNALEFIAAQFAVFGPVIFAVFLIAVIQMRSAEMSRTDRVMLAFAVPPLALVTAMGLFTRLNGNWAAPAFISAIVVVTAVLIRRQALTWLVLSVAIGIVAQAALLVADTRSYTLHLPWLANGDVYHRTLGWHALGEEAGRIARSVGARTIVAERRHEIAALTYYGRDHPEGIAAWPRGPLPVDQFDIDRPLTETTPQPLLLVTDCPLTHRLMADFASVEPLGSLVTPTGPKTARIYFAFKLDGRKGPIRPPRPCLDKE